MNSVKKITYLKYLNWRISGDILEFFLKLDVFLIELYRYFFVSQVRHVNGHSLF